jgi:hypothetical protein
MKGALNFGASVTCHIFPRECNRHACIIHRILDEWTIHDGQQLHPLKNCRPFFETKYFTHLLTIKVFCIQLVHNPLRILAARPRRGV